MASTVCWVRRIVSPGGFGELLDAGRDVDARRQGRVDVGPERDLKSLSLGSHCSTSAHRR
jgi:hypothetical protein